MDTALSVKPPLTPELVRDFYQRYLFLDTGGREHLLVLFYDEPLPAALLEGLRAVPGTRLLAVDSSKLDSQVRFLETIEDPERKYLSIHDFCQTTYYPKAQAAVTFCEKPRGVDYTSFEFPRFGATPEQLETLIYRFVAGDPAEQLRRADAFYGRLGEDRGYCIRVRSGPRRDRLLEVRGPSPWLEICGPLQEGDLRFAPGAELFYSGTAVNGVLHCNAGINLLPLRGGNSDPATCERLLSLSSQLPEEPVDVVIREGRITELRSERDVVAAQLREIFASDEAYSHVIEVGIGLSDAAAPLINGWGATSNEAVPGVHIGIGADPGNTLRFKTSIHLDFVVPDLDIEVNAHPYFQSGRFLMLDQQEEPAKLGAER